MKRLLMMGLVCFGVAGLLSNTATAETRTCELGLINNETVEGDVYVNGTGCYISESVIRGNIYVTDSPWFGITSSSVHGRLQITDSTGKGEVLLKDIFVFDRAVDIDGSALVWVFDSQVVGESDTSNMAFKNITDEVEVLNNIVRGNLTCTEGIPFVLEEQNFVGGKDTCTTGS